MAGLRKHRRPTPRASSPAGWRRANETSGDLAVSTNGAQEVVVFVVGGGGAGPNRNPAGRDFPLVTRKRGEPERAHLARVVQVLDEAMAAGGTHLLVPRERADWLGDHRLVAEYFAQHHDLV